jgi:hypothetical protein
LKAVALALVIAAATPTVAAAPLPFTAAAPLVTRQGAVVRTRLPRPGHDLTLDGKPVIITRDGSFMIGIDRDAAPTAVLAWTTDDGRPARWPVTVAAQAWDTDVLPARLSMPGPPNPEYDARRERELGAVKAARADVSPLPFWQGKFIRPAPGRISTHFGAQRIYGDRPAAPHGGMDIAAPTGTPILSPTPAVVKLATGPFALEGNLVILDHGLGLYSVMMHLSRIDVKPGQIVAQGETIGLVGATGRATGAHLHWGMTWMGVRVDPETLLTETPRTETPQ